MSKKGYKIRFVTNDDIYMKDRITQGITNYDIYIKMELIKYPSLLKI